IASMRETVAGKSRYEAPWPPTKCYSALSASTSPKVPSSPNGATADTRFSMPTRAHRLRACGQPGAMIASNSNTGRPGKKRGRRRGLSGVPCCRSTTHSASSQKKEFSGHAGEFNPGQKCAKSSLEPVRNFLESGESLVILYPRARRFAGTGHVDEEES